VQPAPAPRRSPQLTPAQRQALAYAQARAQRSVQSVRRRPSGFRRFVTAVIALVLVLAVPVVSAYVAYKLSSGENPFQWPPTVDLSRVF
jgi:hypothetical protein